MSDKFNFGIVGAGRMGKAAAHYLANFAPTSNITFFDVDESVHGAAIKLADRMKALGKDVTVNSSTALDLKGLDGIVGSCGYPHYVDVAKRCIQERVNMVDLGGNRDVVFEQRKLHDDVVVAGLTHVPDQGLAPGAINILAMNAVQQLESQQCSNISVVMRVGGLPADPGSETDNPMRYRCTWSPDGLINEYVIPADVIVGGKRGVVPALTELENITFPNGHVGDKFEAFVTGGGSSNLPELLDGRVLSVNYKTIRYTGHYAVAKSLELLGFYDGDPRKVLTEQLEKHLCLKSNDDIVLARAGARGTNDLGKTIMSGTDMVSVMDPDTGFSAMGQTTGYAAGAVLSMICEGVIADKGVVCGEQVVNGRAFIDKIRQTGIDIGPMGSLG